MILVATKTSHVFGSLTKPVDKNNHACWQTNEPWFNTDFQCSTSKMGKRIRYVEVEKSKFLSICEIEVYGLFDDQALQCNLTESKAVLEHGEFSMNKK